MVCNNQTKKCTHSKADLSKAPIIKLNLGNHTLEFTSDDYVYFEDNNLQCRFGDICDQRSEGVCAQDTEVVLGKQFFEKYTPLISINRESGLNTITLLTYFKAPKERVLIWLIIGIIAAVIAVLALIFIILKRRKNDEVQEEDEYKQITGSQEHQDFDKSQDLF